MDRTAIKLYSIAIQRIGLLLNNSLSSIIACGDVMIETAKKSTRFIFILEKCEPVLSKY